MADKADKVRADRRGFLKLAGAGLASGGAALSGGARPAEAREDADRGGQLYRETEHVKAYYQVARF